MPYCVKLTPQAQKDTEDLYKWIIRRAPHQGTTWYNGLIKAIASLAYSPQRCPVTIKGKELNKPVHQLLYGKRPYRIFFWIMNQEVHVLHIRRGAQKPWRPKEL
ncbi:MAG: type II toxin-antitoxin system RelE/ParE family toxin [Elusimicrobiota bacterium]